MHLMHIMMVEAQCENDEVEDRLMNNTIEAVFGEEVTSSKKSINNEHVKNEAGPQDGCVDSNILTLRYKFKLPQKMGSFVWLWSSDKVEMGNEEAPVPKKYGMVLSTVHMSLLINTVLPVSSLWFLML